MSMKRIYPYHQSLVVSAVLLALLASPAQAHKFYVSNAQMEYNPKTKSLEIIIRVFTDDLEMALLRHHRQTVRLDQKEAGTLTLAYLKDRFEIKGRNRLPKKLKWVGLEVKGDSAWLYVEVSAPEGAQALQLRNRLFFELFEEQVNLVNTRFDGKQIGLMYKPGDSFKAITTRDPSISGN